MPNGDHALHAFHALHACLVPSHTLYACGHIEKEGNEVRKGDQGKEMLGNISLRMEERENRLIQEPAPIGPTDWCGHLCK